MIVVVCLTSLGIQAAPDPKPVTVVNDDANPVPVSGAVTVENDAANPVPVIIPEPVQVNMGTNYRFVGRTTSTLPNIGTNGMDSLCQVSYGDEARMCDTKEYFDTPATAGVLSGEAWLWPHIITSYYNAASGNPEHLIYPYEIITGRPQDSICQAWQSTSPTLVGTRVFTFGHIAGETTTIVSTYPCNIALPVACCTPQ